VAETFQQAERRRQAREVEVREEKLTSIHIGSFTSAQKRNAPPVVAVDEAAVRRRIARDAKLPELEEQLAVYGEPPTAPPPEPVDRARVIDSHCKPALRDVPLIRFAERRSVRAAATQAAEEEVRAEEVRRAEETSELQAALDARWDEVVTRRAQVDREAGEAVDAERASREREHERQQRDLDLEWERLQANEPAAVNARVNEELRRWTREQLVVTVLSAEAAGDEVSVVAAVPRPEAVVPAQRSDYTAAGRPTVKKRTQTDRNQLYLEIVSSAVLGICRAVFSAAPGVEFVSTLIVQQESSSMIPIYGGTLRRRADLTTRLPSATALTAGGATVLTSGRTEELKSIEPELDRSARLAYERSGAGAR
jgi:hypothetical protein